MRALSFSLIIVLVSVTGCKNGQLANKRWGGSQYGQGSIDRQTARAATFDPYPLNDIGPEVVGGRPRGFGNPLSEPIRNEMTARPPANPWSQYPNY